MNQPPARITAVTIADIEAAAARIAGAVLATPIVDLAGTGLLLKCENLQRTGSFKIRGATNAIRALGPARVITASSGNHGYAVAWAARAAGIAATVVMPHDASAHKRHLIERTGATVVACDPGTSAREAAVLAVAEETDAVVVPPYDHPYVIAGQGTVGLELAAAVPDTATVIVPVGGGGLISGVACALADRRPAARMVGAEPAAGPRFGRSRAAGRPVEVAVPDTVCDGARVQRPGAWTGPMVEQFVSDLVAVDDRAVVDALRELAAGGLWVEPTGALAVAAARQHAYPEPVVCVVTGRNIAPGALATLLDQPRFDRPRFDQPRFDQPR